MFFLMCASLKRRNVFCSATMAFLPDHRKCPRKTVACNRTMALKVKHKKVAIRDVCAIHAGKSFYTFSKYSSVPSSASFKQLTRSDMFVYRNESQKYPSNVCCWCFAQNCCLVFIQASIGVYVYLRQATQARRKR